MAFTDVICPAIQESLTTIAGQNASILNRTPVGFIDMLVSSENTSGFTKVPIDSGDGRRKMVEVIYNRPSADTDVEVFLCHGTQQAGVNPSPTQFSPGNTDPFNQYPWNKLCSTDSIVEPLKKQIQVRYCAKTKPRLLRKSDLQMICYTGGDEYRANMIMAEIDVLNRKIDGWLQELMYAQFGWMYTGGAPIDSKVSPLQAQILSGSPLQVNYGEMAEVLEQYEANGGTRKPLVVGAGNLATYVRMTQLGCCNDAGIDLGRASGEIYYFRDSIANRPNSNTPGDYGGWGTNFFGVFSPGATQLLTWNENVGEFRATADSFVHDTVQDPITGLKYDFDMVYEPCEKAYKLQLSVNFDLFVMPDDMYNTGPYSGVNGTFLVDGNMAP